MDEEERAWAILTWEISVGALPGSRADTLPPWPLIPGPKYGWGPFSLELWINPHLRASALTVAGQDTCLGKWLALSSLLDDANFCGSCWMEATCL